MPSSILTSNPASKPAQPRALSLDSLRGLAILGMVLSGLLPFFHHTLPSWMYHAQMPPPEHAFRPDVVGITWVDVVFPLFLFCLGAAIPLALWNRLHSGQSRWRLAWSACVRGLLLLFFALYKQHLSAGNLVAVYGQWGHGITIGGFALLFLIFTRFPASWPGWIKVGMRGVGWAAAVALLAVLRYPDGSGFSVHRHDIILVILANVVVTTAIVWLLWPQRVTGRLIIMAAVVTVHLARQFASWGVPVTELYLLKDIAGERIYNGLIWAFAPAYQKYLLITIPGTIAGDIILTWLRPAAQRLSFRIRHSRWRELGMVQCVGLMIVCMLATVATVIGLGFRDWATTCVVLGCLCALGFVLLYGAPARRRLRSSAVLRGQSRVPALMFQRLFTWGVVWLAIGLALYPYQGGIRKDPATLSYFFTTAGLGFLLLTVFAVVTEAVHRPGSLFLLIANGQNPMIAYVAWWMFFFPLLNTVPVGPQMSLYNWIMAQTVESWPSFGRAIILTLIVAVFVWTLTKMRVFWRT